MRHAGLDPAVRADQVRLGYQLGMTPQAIAKVLSGKSKSMSAANNAAAAQQLGVQADWLARGTGAPLAPAAPAGFAATEPAASAYAPSAPLHHSTIEALRALDPQTRGRVEQMLRLAMQLPAEPALGGAITHKVSRKAKAA